MPKIVVLGAGFAGFTAANSLAGMLSKQPECEITLVDEHNYLLFTPMISEIVGDDIDDQDAVAAIRDLSPGITFMQAKVGHIDTEHRQVTLLLAAPEGVPGESRTLEADHLVIALGSETNYHGIPGLEQHSLGIKTVAEAGAIRTRAIQLMERAGHEKDPELQRAMLTFVVGGGGFSGVETMAALNDFVRHSAKRINALQNVPVRTVIAHPGDRLLPELGRGLADYAEGELKKRGVEVMLRTKVTGASADEVQLEDHSGKKTEIPTRLLVWTGGIVPSSALKTIDAKLGHHHGLVVDQCCRVVERPGVWAIGDCAEIPNAGGGTYAPTAQNAMREGPLVAANILATMHDRDPHPFTYHPVGELAVVGRRSGVASIFGLHIRGFPAWAMWRTVYLSKMPSTRKRIRVGVDWLLDLLMGRDLVEPS